MDFRLITKDEKFYTKIKNFNKFTEEEKMNVYINICALRKMLENNNNELKKISKKITHQIDIRDFMSKKTYCEDCRANVMLHNWNRHTKTLKHIHNLENKLTTQIYI
jgi:hypothetical protein